MTVLPTALRLQKEATTELYGTSLFTLLAQEMLLGFKYIGLMVLQLPAIRLGAFIITPLQLLRLTKSPETMTLRR